MRELSDAGCDRLAVDNGLPYATGIERELIRAGYAAGYRAAQAEAGIKPGPLDPCPNYGAMPPSLDRQPAATPAAGRPDAGAAQAVTDGPAADPDASVITYARIGLRYMHDQRVRATYSDLIDLAERMARERDDARAERDALRECIDAADARRKIVSRSNEHLWGAYDAARAKVTLP